MKKQTLPLVILMGFFMTAHAQVGINNSAPTATLDVTAKNATGPATNVDGLLIPRVDRQRAQGMLSVPTSTLIYVNNVATGGQTGTAININAVGYYYFDGIANAWVKLNPSAAADINIYKDDGTLTGNRTVTQGANTLAFNATATNAFSVDGNTFSVDAANNRVGIGTTTPSNRLQLGTDIGSSATDVVGKKLALYNDTSGNDFYGLGINAATLQFHAASTAAEAPGMVLNSVGNVGIGNTAPTARLEVTSGTANTSGVKLTNLTSASPIGTGQSLGIDASGNVITVANPTADINIYKDDGTLTGNRTVTQNANTLAFNGTATNAFSVDGNTFSVDAANNNVGIGTTAPGVKLDVAQAMGTGETTQLRILNTSPVAANNTAYIGFNSYGGGGATWGLGSLQNSNSNTDSNFNILYSNGGTYLKRFTIIPNGNVGIGTTAPTARLEVASGTANDSGMKFSNINSSTPVSSGKALAVDATGKVVTISTSAPTATIVADNQPPNTGSGINSSWTYTYNHPGGLAYFNASATCWSTIVNATSISFTITDSSSTVVATRTSYLPASVPTNVRISMPPFFYAISLPAGAYTIRIFPDLASSTNTRIDAADRSSISVLTF